ncbi:hypothetical protein HanIR_Chr17g0898991 [Helianthus annuus]|nr:hypothetical protein HanIR_Chr17g0898991 [Helianthus annuus]
MKDLANSESLNFSCLVIRFPARFNLPCRIRSKFLASDFGRTGDLL